MPYRLVDAADLGLLVLQSLSCWCCRAWIAGAAKLGDFELDSAKSAQTAANQMADRVAREHFDAQASRCSLVRLGHFDVAEAECALHLTWHAYHADLSCTTLSIKGKLAQMEIALKETEQKQQSLSFIIATSSILQEASARSVHIGFSHLWEAQMEHRMVRMYSNSFGGCTAEQCCMLAGSTRWWQSKAVCVHGHRIDAQQNNVACLQGAQDGVDVEQLRQEKQELEVRGVKHLSMMRLSCLIDLSSKQVGHRLAVCSSFSTMPLFCECTNADSSYKRRLPLEYFEGCTRN
eukprot:1157114-Pelagomonas_calceolata.AAC.4